MHDGWHSLDHSLPALGAQIETKRLDGEPPKIIRWYALTPALAFTPGILWRYTGIDRIEREGWD